jgi:hypothetical protein
MIGLVVLIIVYPVITAACGTDVVEGPYVEHP